MAILCVVQSLIFRLLLSKAWKAIAEVAVHQSTARGSLWGFAVVDTMLIRTEAVSSMYIIQLFFEHRYCSKFGSLQIHWVINSC